ncbi:hypothetical protein DEFDS_P124 (plasmid) [Deferribacter desulfuricans SSM1]|uniref:Uncharacterized protein n=1 Tax=Deferribacter desulfuricans (strain DSM 14783 / JCM 11476 / NBRC 101012 / SSM1) TaxID=639282 RepID=D3PEV4_DEFDS|nr:hypothetical protein [Deferribacter desulfuricans]BAI81746.1 hypothetical protein DEFDS_P124 [Deferribacter desulfuricans SSM1]
MLINSNFKDYYDNLNVYGVDKQIVFNRYQEKIYVQNLFKIDNFPLSMLSCGRYFSFAVLSFCKQVYVCLIMDKSDEKDKKCFYSSNEIRKYITENFEYRRAKCILEEFEGKGSYHKYVMKNSIFKYIDDKLITYNKLKSELLGYNFNLDDYPIVAVQTQSIIVNPIIRTYNFQKIKSPYDARMEIEQWVLNNNLTMKEPEKIDDSILRDMKGFDKISFRKRKQKK